MERNSFLKPGRWNCISQSSSAAFESRNIVILRRRQRAVKCETLLETVTPVLVHHRHSLNHVLQQDYYVLLRRDIHRFSLHDVDIFHKVSHFVTGLSHQALLFFFFRQSLNWVGLQWQAQMRHPQLICVSYHNLKHKGENKSICSE